jgi:hypothetical protein
MIFGICTCNLDDPSKHPLILLISEIQEFQNVIFFYRDLKEKEKSKMIYFAI